MSPDPHIEAQWIGSFCEVFSLCGARLQDVPGAGHWLPLERGDAYNTALRAFLAGR